MSLRRALACLLVALAGAGASGEEGAADRPEYIELRSVLPAEDAAAEKPDGVVSYGLRSLDADRMRALLPRARAMVPLREIGVEARHLSRKMRITAVGTTEAWAPLARLQVGRGRLLTAADNQRYENVIVLGSDVANGLFPEIDPIGKAMKLGTDYYTVVGALRPSDGANNAVAYLPLNTCRLRFGVRIRVEAGGVVRTEERELSRIVIHLAAGEDVQEVRNRVEKSVKEAHPRDDVQILVRRSTPRLGEPLRRAD